jgi:membrane-associated phospholipid phosphatase
MIVLTDFGDLTVLLPVTAALLLWLLTSRAWGTAAWWVIAVAICVGITAVLKIYFTCSPADALQSPSGHTSLSTLIYGAIALIVAHEFDDWRRSVAVVVGIGLIAGIAVSRIVLGAHSPLEVAFGLAIGLVALAVFARPYLRCAPPEPSLRPLWYALLLIAALHGSQLHAETMLRALNHYLHIGAVICA